MVRKPIIMIKIITLIRVACLIAVLEEVSLSLLSSNCLALDGAS